MLLRVEGLDQLAIHEQEQVESLNVGSHVHLAEVGIELLQGEVLEDLLALGDKEASDLLDTSLLLEQLSVLKLGTVLWVVPHQVLGQEDARVETRTDAWVNLVYTAI